MNGYDELGRLRPDLYFMNLCFGVNLRSIDTSSKCGCIAVAEDGAMLSAGYNGPFRGANDKEIPMTRPEKYYFMEHSERNAIYNAARHGIELMGCTFYVTGFPCIDCLRSMIHAGAKQIVYGPLQTKMKIPLEVYEQLLKGQPIKIKRFEFDEDLFELNPSAKKAIDSMKERDIEDITFEWNVFHPPMPRILCPTPKKKP